MEKQEIIKVVSKEGQEFGVSKDVWSLSTTLTHAFEEYKDKEKLITIPLENVESKTISYFISFALIYATLTEEDKQTKISSFNDWETSFLESLKEDGFNDEEKDRNLKINLLKIINMANYLAIQPLIQLCAKRIAREIEGLKSEDVLKKFYLSPENFSKEEKERIDAELSFEK